MFALRGDTIRTAHVSETYALTVDFTRGRSLSVKNDGGGYPCWEANVTDWGFVEG